MVLLVVDTQKGIVDERLYAFETFVSNIRKLIRTAREQGIEVVYVQHDDGPGTGFSTVALMQKSVMMPQTITSFSPFFVRYSSRPLSFLNALHTVLTNRLSVGSGANSE